ncbi:transposable element Tcb2 transposase [Trichonephila clavipes]|nr:transposable element Tcb2 transposase [Trichonephila clavipes]
MLCVHNKNVIYLNEDGVSRQGKALRQHPEQRQFPKTRKRAQRNFECYCKEKDYTSSKENSTLKCPEICIIDIIRNWEKISVEIVRCVLQDSGFHNRTPRLGSNFIFQQDNDPKHTAKSVKLYLLYHCKKELHTPPQSPDLNVIENVWSQLEKSIHVHPITSKDDLKNVLKKKSGPKSQWKPPKTSGWNPCLKSYKL